MADLASLMNVAPITGGMMIGRQANSEMDTADVERQRLAQLVQELQLKNQQSVGMNPLLQQFQQGQNDAQKAQLPGIQAKSLMDQLTAQQKQGTIGSDTSAAISGNENAVRENKQKGLDALQQDLMKYGSTLDSTPVPLRAGKLISLMQASGHNMDDPNVQNLVGTIISDPQNMHTNLQAAADHIGAIRKAQDPTYLASTENEKLRSSTSIKTAGIQAGATLGAAKIGADSRLEVQAARNDLQKYKIDQTQNIQQRIVELQKQPQSPERDALLDQLVQMAAAINPQISTAISLPSLEEGKLRRQGDVRKPLVPQEGKTSSGVKFRVLQQ